MKILGIDYGRAKIGLAISEAVLAEPWKVIHASSMEEAIGKVESAFAKASADKQVEQVVVGVSEGKMGEEQKQFAQKIANKLAVPVETWDETLSTQKAQRLAIEAGISKAKRQGLEDAFAATVMLQSYLENHGEDTPSV